METSSHSSFQERGIADPVVWIIVRESVFAESVAERLRKDGAYAHLRLFPSCDEALAHIRSNYHPEVILVDISDSARTELAAITQLRALSPAARILVLAPTDDDDTVIQAICAGATGYFLREHADERIVGAIGELLAGGTPMEPAVAQRILSLVSQLAPHSHEYHLTNRERDILRLIAEGCVKKEIAEKLYISHFTVDTHLKNIYEKMHVHSQAGAISKAYKDNLLK